MAVRLRDYNADDLEAMYALDLVCFEQAFRFSKRAMRRFAEAEGAITVVAEDATGEIAGFAIVQMEGKTGYVVTLDVTPTWRRQGVARRLMDEMEERVVAAGGEAMALHVFAGNSVAMRFYERAGYQQIGSAPRFYGRGLDGLVYGKQLTL